jgi:hypothetical protein
MEVADDRDMNSDSVQPFDNVRHCLGRSIIVDGYPDEFRSCAAESRNLLDSSWDVRRIGVGHRLHNHGSIATDAYLADQNSRSLPALNVRHGTLSLTKRRFTTETRRHGERRVI